MNTLPTVAMLDRIVLGGRLRQREPDHLT